MGTVAYILLGVVLGSFTFSVFKAFVLDTFFEEKEEYHVYVILTGEKDEKTEL